MFASATVTKERLSKGFSTVQEMCKVRNVPFTAARTGEFMDWLWRDIFSEEAGEMEERGVELEQAKKEIGNLGKKWFKEEMKVVKKGDLGVGKEVSAGEGLGGEKELDVEKALGVEKELEREDYSCGGTEFEAWRYFGYGKDVGGEHDYMKTVEYWKTVQW
jgi:hypothetical protein